MVVRMRATRSHTKNRRSHHAIKDKNLAPCSNCNAQTPRHNMCPECGFYRGKMVKDVAAQKAKKLEKAKKREEQEGRQQ